MYNIAIASDHAGFDLKQKCISLLNAQNYRVLDCGTNSAAHSVDYPDYAKIVCEQIADYNVAFGILICATGIGMSIAANRLSNIRAAVCCDENMAFLARAHNNANILVLGAKIIPFDIVVKIINKFFSTKFEGGRHLNRIGKIS